jgi:hypothetical protein
VGCPHKPDHIAGSCWPHPPDSSKTQNNGTDSKVSGRLRWLSREVWRRHEFLVVIIAMNMLPVPFHSLGSNGIFILR